MQKWMSIIVLLVFAQGCTNSKLIIGPLYNRLDNQMLDQFNELGEFTAEQTAAFEVRLGNYHVWHRQSELPKYASLMQALAGSIANVDTTAADINNWFDTAELHSLKARQCHPVNFMFDFMKSLTDDQISSIETHFAKEQQENLERYQSRTPEERIQRRLDNLVKWAGRINLNFTPAQRAIFFDAFKQQTSLRQEYYALSGEWNSRFFTLARQHDDPDFNIKMSKHINSLWRMMETEHPQQWKKNREIWKKASLRFVQSLSTGQRRIVSRWIDKMALTLQAISQDKPSFNYVEDASLGCLIDPDKA